MKHIKSTASALITLCALLFCLEVNAQRLTLSSELGYFTSDENIPAISRVWTEYIQSLDLAADTSRFWMDGSRDIHINLHKDGFLNTYNIRKLTDTIYEINTIAYYPASVIKGGLVNAIYKVCAAQTESGWRLMNYFDVVKNQYKQYSIGSIDFCIGNGVFVDRKRMQASARFAERFINRYNLDKNNRITYVSSASIDESSAMIGLVYTPIRSYKQYAGRTINNIVLSTRLDHIHEVVHAIMLPLYPNAPLFLHEGIASYYGGLSGLDYKDVKSRAKVAIDNENVDLNDKDTMAILLENDISLSNVMAAAIIEHTLQQGGESAVLQLFKAINNDQIFELLGVTNDQRAHFIRRLF